MVDVWLHDANAHAWRRLDAAARQPREPVRFEPAAEPAVSCPAYRGEARGHHRCAANDLPPWEKFDDYARFEPGVATCGQCNWPRVNQLSSRRIATT
jgi:hypothetical protein